MSKQHTWAELPVDDPDEDHYTVINLAQATEIVFRDRWVEGYEEDIHRVAEIEMSNGAQYELVDDDARAAERWVKAQRIEEG